MDELRSAVRSAFERMEQAHKALSEPAEDADIESLQRDFDESEAEHRSATERLARAEKVEEARAAAPVEPVEETPEPESRGDVRVGKEPLTYEPAAPTSFFRDLYMRNMQGDWSSGQRLERHMQEMRVEKRDRTPHAAEARDLSSTDSAGGYLVAPIWLQDEFVNLARAGRVTANVIGSRPLPPNTDSINIPTMATGVTVAAQADNASVSETDATFSTVAADVKTIAGLQDVSQQLLDRSVPGIDQVIFADLTAAYNVSLDTAVLSSATSNNLGISQVSGINTSTYTDASPTLAELYPKIADGVQKIHTNIFMPATAILMHPRRWAFALASVDGNNRPLIVPNANNPQNAAGTFGGVEAEGFVGTIQGLPVYVDPNITTTNGASTNEDQVYVVRVPDLFLWEDNGPYLDTFRDVLSANLGVRFRLFNYYAQCHARRPKAISAISGTGLVTPTF